MLFYFCLLNLHWRERKKRENGRKKVRDRNEEREKEKDFLKIYLCTKKRLF